MDFILSANSISVIHLLINLRHLHEFHIDALKYTYNYAESHSRPRVGVIWC